MSYFISDKFSLELSINDNKINFSQNSFESLVIHESVIQSLPTSDIIIINDGSLIDDNPLVDGSIIEIDLKIYQSGVEEDLKIEMALWSHEIELLSEGYRIILHCVLNIPDFLDSKIESINGSSFEVFKLLAERSGMDLIADSSIDKQVWIRPGIRGNIWLNEVVNRSWASNKSHFVYAVTRNKELLRYNLDERSSKKSVWFFKPDRELNEVEIDEDVVLYKYPIFKSQSGFLNTFFGYGRKLSNFDVELGEIIKNSPKSFSKKTNHMNLNNNRETSQRHDSLGFGNSLNVHDNYFNAYVQNLRLKSFYSSIVDLMSDFPKPVKLLDRTTLQIFNEGEIKNQNAYSGDYFVSKISTIVDPNLITRRYSLVREGINSESGYNSK